MTRWAYTFLLLLCAIDICVLNAQEIEDPFANSAISQSTTKNTDERSDFSISWALIGLHEQDERNDASILNSDFNPHVEKNSRLQFDLESQYRISKNINVRGRWLILQESLGYLDSNNDLDNSTDELLEGYFQWRSANNDLNLSLGRVKPVWSNGFNWGPANLLFPYYERPNYDEDNIQQQKGWDLIELEKHFDFWSVSALVADFSSQSLPDSEFQSALRFVIQNGWDASLILYKVDQQKLDAAITYSSLLNDATTLRLEWARQNIRELSVDNGDDTNEEFWDKSVIGITTRFARDWDLSLEYLHNQHGFSDPEWEGVYENIELANNNIVNGTLVAESVLTLNDTSQMFQLGQLRRNYLYLSVAENQDASFWQYKQSVQVNLDDDSRLHRLQLIHNWTDRFNTKLQFEFYEGCDSCEFGLLPSQQSIRLSFYYRN